jgi:integrase
VRPALELNEKAIKAAVNGDVLRDAEIHGLHLRCFPTKKAFYLFFRTKGGKQRRPKIGNYGDITLTQARAAAKAMLAEVAAGKDPQGVRVDARNEPTANELWAEFWKRHASKKKSKAGDLTNWNKHLGPTIGKLRLSEVTYEVMSDLHEDITEETPTAANRVLALASKMFNFAHRPLKWTAVNDNPCRGVKRNKETKRRRKASREELARVVARLRRELEGANAASAAFVWLLLFTGARKGEIAHARFDNIEGNRILLDEHKTDDGGYARIIYLPPAAREVIDKYLPVTSGTITGILSPKKFWATICADEDLPDLTMHDLRRTFASVALSTGQLSLEQVMQMLGHTSAQTTKVYAWLMEDTATDAVGLVGDAMLG